MVRHNLYLLSCVVAASCALVHPLPGAENAQLLIVNSILNRSSDV